MSIDINNVISLVETVEVEETTDGMTAYSVFTLTEKVFDSVGLVWLNSKGNKQTSQATYNDARNGKIDGVKGGGNRRYDEDDVMTYIARLLKKAGYKAPTQVETV
jgi:UTP-glucose-1-phosphate uridylyltransferase